MSFKSIFLCSFLLFFGATALSQEKPRPSTIVWQKDYKLALKAAQAAGKPILIDFNADWCPPCRTMEKIFWSRPDIVKLAGDFVCLQVDYDRDKATIELFGVKSIPHVVVADPWGNMLAFHHGFGRGESENAIRLAMKNAQKDFSEIQEPNWRLEINKDDHAASIKIGEFYRSINQIFLSNKYFKQALASRQLKTNAAAREKILAATAENYLKLRDYDEAERIFAQTLREFPNGANTESAFYGLITIGIRRQNFALAETVFAQMKAKFPDSEITRRAAENLHEAKSQTN